MHKLIIAHDRIEYPDRVEFDYYSHPYHNAEWFKSTIYAYCTGSFGHDRFVDEHLREE